LDYKKFGDETAVGSYYRDYKNKKGYLYDRAANK
jgi:hypothetical protein